jgi:uncharacterized protein (TIGR03067 family)
VAITKAKERVLNTAICLSGCAVVLAMATFDANGQDKGKDDKFDAAKLAGTWKYVSGVKNGEKLDADHLKGQTVKITKENVTLSDGTNTFVMKYTLEAKNKPVGIKLEITESPFGAGMKAGGSSS